MNYDEITGYVQIQDSLFTLLVLFFVTAWCFTCWLGFRMGLDVGRDDWFGRHNHRDCPKEDPDEDYAV